MAISRNLVFTFKIWCGQLYSIIGGVDYWRILDKKGTQRYTMLYKGTYKYTKIEAWYDIT